MLQTSSFAVRTAGRKIASHHLDGARGLRAASAKHPWTCRVFFRTDRSRLQMPASEERCSISRDLFSSNFMRLGEATAREWPRFWMNWRVIMLKG